jgi:transposase
MGRNTVVRAGSVTIGIDIGDKNSEVCGLDDGGAVIERASIPTTAAGFEKRFGGRVPARIALEVGTHSPWVSRLLRSAGHEVLVANARKLKLIYANDNKTDRVDAERLARVARFDPSLLVPIEHRSEEMQVDRALLKARDGLVRARTGLIIQVRGLVKSVGGRLPKCSTCVFPKAVSAHVPRAMWPAISPLLNTIARLTVEIRRFDKRVVAVARKKYPVTDQLSGIPGVGPVTALAFVLTIGNPRRFKNSRAVGSYLGLRPRKSESGQSDPQLRITKAGDSFMRCLLVQAAQYTLGPFAPDSDLRRWGLAIAARGGKNGKKRAIIGVSRKLSVILHRMWITGRNYVPLRENTIKSN